MSMGWLCNIIWGEKGFGKSNRLLQNGYTVFHGFDSFEEVGNDPDTGEPIQRGVIEDWGEPSAWQNVLNYTIFRPKDFANMLIVVLEKKQRLSWVGWDDINIHFPRSMYSTNRKLWEQFSRNWEGFRPNLSIFECSAPRKDTVVSFILKDMNWDTLVSGRKKVETVRWFWDRDFYEPEKVNKFRLDVDSDPLEIGHVPDWVWKEYWRRKMDLIDESTVAFREMLQSIDNLGMVQEPSKDQGTFICDVCKRSFGNSYNLRVHKLTHEVVTK